MVQWPSPRFISWQLARGPKTKCYLGVRPLLRQTHSTLHRDKTYMRFNAHFAESGVLCALSELERLKAKKIEYSGCDKFLPALA